MKSPNHYVLEEYKSRINRVIDYIDANLDENFTLEGLAEVANFSKYHFGRIFASLVGETLFRYIARIRIEKSAALIAGSPKKSLTEIAGDCGFADSAVLSRCFKSRFGTSPSRYRLLCAGGDARNSTESQKGSIYNQTFGNFGKEVAASSCYTGSINTQEPGRSNMQGKVEVRDFPESTVAYVRYMGPYKGDAKLFEGLFGKLMAWAGPWGLATADAKSLIIYHDNPDITEEEKLRVSVCLTVPADTKVEGEIGKMTIEKGRYAFARFSLLTSEYGEAWNWVFGTWLPGSGYQCDDRPCFELYHTTDEASGRMTVDICVPVRML